MCDRWLCFGVLTFWIVFLQVFSAPMGQIFDRLQAFGEFEVGNGLSQLIWN